MRKIWENVFEIYKNENKLKNNSPTFPTLDDFEPPVYSLSENSESDPLKQQPNIVDQPSFMTVSEPEEMATTSKSGSHLSEASLPKKQTR